MLEKRAFLGSFLSDSSLSTLAIQIMAKRELSTEKQSLFVSLRSLIGRERRRDKEASDKQLKNDEDEFASTDFIIRNNYLASFQYFFKVISRL